MATDLANAILHTKENDIDNKLNIRVSKPSLTVKIKNIKKDKLKIEIFLPKTNKYIDNLNIDDFDSITPEMTFFEVFSFNNHYTYIFDTFLDSTKLSRQDISTILKNDLTNNSKRGTNFGFIFTVDIKKDLIKP